MRDRGAQPERTRLAWRRTILTATVVTILCVRQALSPGPTPRAVLLAAVIGLAWVGLVVGAQLRIRTLARARPGAMRPPWPALASVGVLTLAALAALTVG